MFRILSFLAQASLLTALVTMEARAQDAIVRKLRAPEKSESAEITWGENHGAVVQATINGQPVSLLLGPSRDLSLLTADCAERLGLKPLKGYTQVTLASHLNVAGAEAENEPFILVPSAPGWPDVLLGHSFLREFGVEVDFTKARLSLYPPEGAPLGGLEPMSSVSMEIKESEIGFDGTEVKARRGHFYVELEAEAEGGVRLPAFLEPSITGSPTLPESLLRSKLPSLQPENGMATLPGQLLLGKMVFANLPFTIMPENATASPDHVYITADVMRHFQWRMMLDYAGRRVHLAADRASFSVKGPGLELRQEDTGWVLLRPLPDSVAARAGLAAGDLLVSIKDTACHDMPLDELNRLILTEGERKMVFRRRAAVEGEPDQEIVLEWTMDDEWPADPAIGGHLREWAFTGGASEAVLPLDASYGLAFVTVVINGHPLRMAVDTGFGMSSVQPETAKLLGLEPKMEMAGVNVAGEKFFMPVAGTSSIALGPLVIQQEPVGINRLPSLPERIDGILGLAPLRDFLFCLDWQAKTLTITPRTAPPSEPAGMRFDLNVEESWVPASDKPQRWRPASLKVDLEINGRKFPFLVDSGHTAPLALPAAVLEALPGLAETLPARRAFAGRGAGDAALAGKTVRLPEFSLAGETVKDLTVMLREAEYGLIGAGMLRHFATTFDVAGGAMFLRPHGTMQELKEGSSLNISFDFKDGALVIAALSPESPAFAAGLREGDIVETINGQTVQELIAGGFAKMRALPPGSRILFAVKRGLERLEVTVVTVPK